MGSTNATAATSTAADFPDAPAPAATGGAAVQAPAPVPAGGITYHSASGGFGNSAPRAKAKGKSTGVSKPKAKSKPGADGDGEFGDGLDFTDLGADGLEEPTGDAQAEVAPAKGGRGNRYSA